MPTDVNGHKIKVGSEVRLIRIDPEVFIGLPQSEAKDVSSMCGEVFEVYEVDDHGFAWVEKTWSRENGLVESHSISVRGSDVELVSG